jgi:hypothetical protein
MSALTSPLIEVELGSQLGQCADATACHAIQQLLERRLAEVTADLGLVLSPAVAVRGCEADRAIRIRVDGRVRPYPLSVFRRAWLAVAPDDVRSLPIDAPPTEAGIYPDVWLSEALTSGNPAVRAAVPDYVVRLVAETLALHPECLISTAAAAAFLGDDEADPAGEEWSTGGEKGVEVLTRLLDLGVALRPRELVRRLVADRLAAGGDVVDTVEAVFARLAESRIVVRANPDFLDELNVRLDGEPVPIDDTRLPEELREAAAVVQDHLLQLGISRPIVLDAASDVAFDEVQVRINDHPGLPISIARPDEIVAHAPPWKVDAPDGTARVLVDAASGHRLTAVKREAADFLTTSVARTTALEFLAVAIAREVTPFAYRLLTIEDLERELGNLAGGFPLLVEAALERSRSAQLTSLLRRLLRERVSARDLWSILNALLRYDKGPLVSERLNDVAAFLRQELAERVVYDSGGPISENRLPVLDVQPDLEERVRQSGDDGDDAETIRRVVRQALLRVHAPADAIVLTSEGARGKLFELLAHEFPSIYVLDHAEIPAHVELHKLASIGA